VRMALSVLLVTTVSYSYGQTGTRHSVSGRAEVKKNAAEQLAYARQLVSAIPANADREQQMSAVMDAVTALRIVADKWPAERAAVTESHLLQARVWLNRNFLRSALGSLEDAEKSSPGTSAMAQIQSEKGFVYRRMGNNQEAAAAFDRAEHHPGFHALPIPTMAATLSEFAEVELQLGRPRDASTHLRAAAELPTLAPINRLNLLLRSLEANDRAGDKLETKKDLGKLDEVLFEARKSLGTGVGDVAAINEIEKQVKRHHARLGL